MKYQVLVDITLETAEGDVILNKGQTIKLSPEWADRLAMSMKVKPLQVPDPVRVAGQRIMGFVYALINGKPCSTATCGKKTMVVKAYTGKRELSKNFLESSQIARQF